MFLLDLDVLRDVICFVSTSFLGVQCIFGFVMRENLTSVPQIGIIINQNNNWRDLGPTIPTWAGPEHLSA